MNYNSKLDPRKGLVFSATAALITALALAGCASHDDSGPGASGDGDCVVTFGADTELSGPIQHYGVPAADGLNAAVDDINAAGGLKVGDDTCDFAALVADNKSDPAEVFPAAQEVVDGEPVAALLPDLNDTVAYDAFKKSGVISFSTGGQVSSSVESDPDGTPDAVALIPFQVLQHESYLKQAQAFAPDIETMAILWPADQAGQQIHDQFVAAAKNVGIEVVGDVSYPNTTTDYSSFITKASDDDPDLLVTEYSSEQSMAIMQQAVPLNAAKYYLSETATAETVQATKGLENATVLLPTFAPTYSGAMTLPHHEPEVIFGDGPAPMVPGASIVLYYAAWLTKQAVEEAGSTDTDKVFAALKGQSYDGPFGTCSITDDLFMQCNTAFVIVQGDKVTAEEFADPYSSEPMGTYDCVEGECTSIEK